MDLLVLIGAILGLYVVVAVVIYSPGLWRRDDHTSSSTSAARRREEQTRARLRKDWRQYWL